MHHVGTEGLALLTDLPGHGLEQFDNVIAIRLQAVLELLRLWLGRRQVDGKDADGSANDDVEHAPGRLLPGDRAEGEDKEHRGGDLKLTSERQRQPACQHQRHDHGDEH